jgi:hypothetical protein
LALLERRAALSSGFRAGAIPISSQASVQSIDGLKDLRTAFALFAEDAQAALGAVEMEIRRTIQWLQHDRRFFWQEQIKRRRELVSQAEAEVFRRKLGQASGSAPAYSEQKEVLRKAEASLRDAERRAALVKKYEPVLQQAILEYHAATRRITDIARGDVPRAVTLLERMIDSLEAYLRVAAPSGSGGRSAMETVADEVLTEDALAPAAEAASGPQGDQHGGDPQGIDVFDPPENEEAV